MFSYTTNVSVDAGVTLINNNNYRKKKNAVKSRKTSLHRTPHTFSLIRYGYCYYRGELPVGWNSMNRDFLKPYSELYRLNESDFTLG